MTGDFAGAFGIVVGIEGGMTTDSRDRGNWTSGICGVGICRGTKYGISAAAYPTLDIANLTLDDAAALYRIGYWTPLAGDALPAGIALLAFDCAVNQGLHTAATMLQASVGVAQDGQIGPLTIRAINYRDHVALISEFASRRAVRYAQGNVATYGLGWFRRLFSISIKAISLETKHE